MTENISGVLQAIRANLELTQTELAERLGVSFTTVNRWEGGDATSRNGPNGADPHSGRRGGCRIPISGRRETR